MEDPRIRKFAQFLIRSAVGLEKGEKILIELHGSETGLMKSLVQEAYAVGGKPFVHIFDYAVEGALVQGADAEHMEEIASYELERMRDMDAYIDIRATTNISMWHNVSDEAQKRYRQYYWGPIHLAERCNHTKWSVLRYPNDAMAQLAGVSTEEYEDFYFRACLVDYDKMGRAMQPLQDLMARTDKVRIVAPGTDISFSIKGIPSFGMHGNRNIPDGEIYTSPVKNSVNGHITYNVPSPYDGFLFRDVYLEFNGRQDRQGHQQQHGLYERDPGHRRGRPVHRRVRLRCEPGDQPPHRGHSVRREDRRQLPPDPRQQLRQCLQRQPFRRPLGPDPDPDAGVRRGRDLVR